MKSKPLVMITYTGLEDNVYQVVFGEPLQLGMGGQSVEVAECSKPCDFVEIRKWTPRDGLLNPPQVIRAEKGSIMWAITQDAMNGKLERFSVLSDRKKLFLRIGGPIVGMYSENVSPQSRPAIDLPATVEKTGICKGLDLTITVDMHECLDRKFTVADKELNALYKDLMAKLDNVQQAKLKSLQMAWIKDKEVTCANAGKEEGGTLEGLMIGDCKVQKTEERVKFLKAYTP